MCNEWTISTNLNQLPLLFPAALPHGDCQSSFNRLEDDFGGDLKAYNDYLETMEDIIFDLCSGDKDEVERAQARVREYEEQNRPEITKNAAKK